MKHRELILLLGVLALLTVAAVPQPVGDLGVITLTPGIYQGTYEFTITSRTFTNISIDEITESQAFGYMVTAKGPLQVEVFAGDRAVLRANAPDEMSIYELHFFDFTSPKLNCHELGSMNVPAKVFGLAHLSNSNYDPLSESFKLPFQMDVGGNAPAGSGSSEKCKFPVSQQTLRLWIDDISGAINKLGQVEFGVFEASPMRLGGAVWIPNWDSTSPISYGSLEQKSTGFWYAYSSPGKPGGWHK